MNKRKRRGNISRSLENVEEECLNFTGKGKNSCYFRGKQYLLGEGVKQDYYRAAMLYYKSAISVSPLIKWNKLSRRKPMRWAGTGNLFRNIRGSPLADLFDSTRDIRISLACLKGIVPLYPSPLSLVIARPKTCEELYELGWPRSTMTRSIASEFIRCVKEACNERPELVAYNYYPSLFDATTPEQELWYLVYFHWPERALKYADAQAMRALAKLFDSGIIVEKNPAKAAMYRSMYLQEIWKRAKLMFVAKKERVPNSFFAELPAEMLVHIWSFLIRP